MVSGKTSPFGEGTGRPSERKLRNLRNRFRGKRKLTGYWLYCGGSQFKICVEVHKDEELMTPEENTTIHNVYVPQRHDCDVFRVAFI